MKDEIEKVVAFHIVNLNNAIKDIPERAEAFYNEITHTNNVKKALSQPMTKNFPEIKPIEFEE